MSERPTLKVLPPFCGAKNDFEPVRRCIYCGALVYDEMGGALRREHVLAEGLGGRWVLPEASCKACEKATNWWETKVLEGPMWGVRRYLKLPQKAGHTKRAQLPLFRANTDARSPSATGELLGGTISLRIHDLGEQARPTPAGSDDRVMVDVEHYPALLMILAHPLPSILTGQPQGDGRLWVQVLNVDGETLRHRYVSIVGFHPESTKSQCIRCLRK